MAQVPVYCMDNGTALYPVFKKMYYDTRGKLFLQRLLPGK
jgi:hypothetical protein